MPIQTFVSLTNSAGLGRVLQFNGLGVKITVLPTIETCGEPIISKQPIYFLEDVEAAAKTRITEDSVLFQWRDEYQRDSIIEYILDNYLFAYSVSDDNSRITSKVEKGSFLADKIKDRYILGDRGNIEFLAVDLLNDRSIISCKDTTNPDFSLDSDWRLFNNYFADIYDRYVKEIDSILDRKVVLRTKGKEEMLPMLRFLRKPYKYDDLVHISNYVDYVEENDPHLKEGIYEYNNNYIKFKIPMQHISARDVYNKYLLDMYFAGLREGSPTVQFKHFYNIIEYVFEDATVTECRKHLPDSLAKYVVDLSNSKSWKDSLDKAFRYDKDKLNVEETQLRIAINMLVEQEEFKKKIESFDAETKEHFLKPTSLTKEVKLPPLCLSDSNLLDKYSSRIYLIRNSVIHTKRKMHGKRVPPILPFSEEEIFLEKEIPLLKFVVQKVIQREKEIFSFTATSFSPPETFLLFNLLSENKNYDTLIRNLGFFLFNLSTKLKGDSYYDLLDPIIEILAILFDELRLHNPDKLEPYRQELHKIDLSMFDEITQAVIECLIFLLQNEMGSFSYLVRKLPRITMRANLYRLQNSMNWYFERTGSSET
jgi:hypothetical protein